MKLRLAALGLSTVESIPFFHLAPGGSAARLLMVGSDRPLYRCEGFDVCLFGRAPSEFELYEVPLERVLSRARAWGVDVLLLDGLEPLGALEPGELEALAASARRLGMIVAARTMGVAGVDYIGLLDAVVVDYMPDYWYDVATSADAIKAVKAALEAGVWLEASAYLEYPEYPGVHPLILALRGSRVPLHLHVKHHMGGGRLNRLAEEARRDLEFVYVHNDLYPSLDTLCPSCTAPVAARDEGFLRVLELGEGGRCWKCGYPLPFRHVRKKKTPESLLYTLGGVVAWYPVDRLAG